VAAINWTERRLLLGECKWGEEDIGRSVIASLILERGPRLLARLEGEWQVEYIFFAHEGFTVDAQALAEEQEAQFVTLAQLDGDLSAWLQAYGSPG
jgi:uncharacterized protein